MISKLKNIQFVFLPVLYENPEPNSSDPYYNFQIDTTFLGNMQPFVFFFIIFVSIYAVFWALSSIKINKFTSLRKKAKKIFRSRMRYSFLYEIFYYTEYYVLFFAFYQFSGANTYLKNSAMNLAVAVIVVILYVAWLLIMTYASIKNKLKLNEVPQKHKFLVL